MVEIFSRRILEFIRVRSLAATLFGEAFLAWREMEMRQGPRQLKRFDKRKIFNKLGLILLPNSQFCFRCHQDNRHNQIDREVNACS